MSQFTMSASYDIFQSLVILWANHQGIVVSANEKLSSSYKEGFKQALDVLVDMTTESHMLSSQQFVVVAKEKLHPFSMDRGMDFAMGATRAANEFFLMMGQGPLEHV